jgi:RNA polymerase sigma-70 factor (ECF subfamily)
MGSLGEDFDPALAQARAGKAPGFEALWRAYAGSVAGYLRLQGASDPDAVTSEVFLGAFRGLSGFEGNEERFRAWLFTIAHRRLVDDRRFTSRRPVTSAFEETWVGPAGPSAEDDAMRQASAARVEEQCASLPSDQREVILLRVVAELTVEEVAEAIGRSPGAVKALQHRALVSLRKTISLKGVPQ